MKKRKFNVIYTEIVESEAIVFALNKEQAKKLIKDTLEGVKILKIWELKNNVHN